MIQSPSLGSCSLTPRVGFSRTASLLLVGIFVGLASPAHAVCVDADGDGFGAFGDPSCPSGATPDCDDGNASVYPGKLLVPSDVGDGSDNDCNGGDECFFDGDADTYGSTSIIDDDGDGTCDDSPEVLDSTDCDDTDITINPAAVEICDGLDNNCVDGIDEGGVCAPAVPAMNPLGMGTLLLVVGIAGAWWIRRPGHP